MTESKQTIPQIDLSDLEPYEIKKLANNAKIPFRKLRKDVYILFIRKVGSKLNIAEMNEYEKARVFATTGIMCMFADKEGPKMSWPNYYLHNVNKVTKTAAERRLQLIARETNISEAIRNIMILTEYLKQNGNGIGSVDPELFYKDLLRWNTKDICNCTAIRWMEKIYSMEYSESKKEKGEK